MIDSQLSDFGDFEVDDAYDEAPADPEQVARKLAALQGDRWGDLSEEERTHRVELLARLLDWLKRQGAL